jgi:hypothetical protein
MMTLLLPISLTAQTSTDETHPKPIRILANFTKLQLLRSLLIPAQRTLVSQTLLETFPVEGVGAKEGKHVGFGGFEADGAGVGGAGGEERRGKWGRGQMSQSGSRLVQF